MKVGKAIKLCRNQLGITQGNLAKKSGISVSYLSQIEADKKDPSVSTIAKISGSLDVPLSILFFLASESDEIHFFDTELAEKLSHITLRLLREKRAVESLF